MESHHKPWHHHTPTSGMLLPFLPWLKNYSRESLKADLVAGLTVGAILIPQAMAYAILAGLPPIVGFYAAVVGSIFAALWGGSAKLSTGPVSVVSFLVFSSLATLADPGSSTYIVLAAALALLSGLMMLLLGLFRLGFVMRVIPHSVVDGFAAAAAIIIVITQLPALFGFSAEHSEFMLPMAVNIAFNIVAMHGPTVMLGVASLITILGLKRLSPQIPAALLVLVAGTVASYFFDFRALGIAVVGAVPSQLPSLGIPILSLDGWLMLLNKAWIIALVGFVSTYAITRTMGRGDTARVDVDQELIGQGIANIAAGLFRGFPVSGSFSRTAINIKAGAETGLSNVFAAVAVCIAMLIMAPAFAYIPLALLAAIIILAVIDLVDIARLREIYRISRIDGIIALVTFSAALLIKPDDAIAIGVVVALALFVRRIVWAKVRVLGIEREWNILQSADTSENIETFPDVLILRIETSAFYGNVEYIIRAIDDLIAEAETRGESVRAVVLDCSSISYMDLSGAETLKEYFESLYVEGIVACGIYMHRGVVERLELVGAMPYFAVVHNIKEMRAVLGLTEASEQT